MNLLLLHHRLHLGHLQSVQKTVGDDMILHRSEVEKVLQDLDSQQSPDDVLEKMELDGTLLRQQNGTWLLLE